MRTVILRLGLLVLGMLGMGMLGSGLDGCGRGHSLALSAERAAPVGGEFLRFYADSTAEYGYAVVKENIKAKGNYRYSGDTLYFLSEAFKPHFPEGLITIRGDTLYMASGLHFKITKNKLSQNRNSKNQPK